MPSFKCGQIIGPYKIVETNIAAGGNGVVHKAENKNGKLCAIKILNREAFLAHRNSKNSKNESQKDLDSFYSKESDKLREEFKKVLGLKHPNVAQMLDLGYIEDHFFIVSEFITGKNLYQFLRGRRPLESLPLIIKVLEGLEFFHKHDLIHLDITPKNIIVSEEESGPCPKLIDFGAALTIQDKKIKPRGTLEFMAPEVLLSQIEKIDARADFYSFGHSIAYILTGRLHNKLRRQHEKNVKELNEYVRKEQPPPSLTDYNESVPEFLNKIILNMMQLNPEDRPSNERAIINALLTQRPDEFKKIPRARSSYLIPERDRHIGRHEVQAKLQNKLLQLVTSTHIDKPVTGICGETGFGKTHLLKSFKERATGVLEKINIHHIELPSNEDFIAAWAEKINVDFVVGTKPVLILIDNIDYAMERTPDHLQVYNTLSAIGRLLREFAFKKPVLTVFTSHNIPPSPIPVDHNFIEVIELQPFSMDEVKEYVSTTPALQNCLIPEKWIQSLNASTSGIPSEVSAHLEELDAKGLLFGSDGKLILSSLQEPDMEDSFLFRNIPQKTEERLSREYNGLSEVEKTVLKWIVCWSPMGIVPPPTFNDLIHFIPYPTLGQILLNLTERQILNSNKRSVGAETTFDFVNPLEQSMIYKTIFSLEIEVIHDSIARYFEKKDVEIANLHWGYGSDKYKAAHHLAHLGMGYHLKGKLIWAETLLVQALTYVPQHLQKLKVYILARLLAVYHHRGKYTAAETTFDTVSKLLDDMGPKGTKTLKMLVLSKFIPIMLERGKKDRALGLIKEALALCHKEDPSPFRVIFNNYMASHSYMESFSNISESKKFLGEAEFIYRYTEKMEKSLHPTLAGVVQNNNLGRVLKSQGEYAAAIAAFQNKLEKIPAGKNRIYERLPIYLFLTECHLFQKNHKEAQKWVSQAIELARRTGQGKWLMHAHMMAASVYYDMDKYNMALDEDRSALVASAFLENEEEHARIMKSLMIRQGHYLKELGQWNEAVAQFDAAIAANIIGFDLMQAHVGLGEVYLHKKNYEKALEHIQKAEKLLNNTPDESARPYLFRIGMIQANSMKHLGKLDTANAALSKLKNLAGNDSKLVKEYNDFEKSLLGADGVRQPL